MTYSSNPTPQRSRPDPEAFIPLTRRQLVERCLAHDRFSAGEHDDFRRFCEILAAFLHYDLHDELENFKAAYAEMNPDAETNAETAGPAAGQRVIELFRDVVKRANYRSVTDAELARALAQESLIDVRTEVNLDDFHEVVAFCRGDVWSTTVVKKLFRKRDIEIDVLQRVALLLWFKDAAHFDDPKSKRKSKDLPFQPGKIYLYLYKDVPKNDIELLFPNVQISMNWKDRLLLGVPAAGATIAVLVKLIPKILVVVGVIAFFTVGPDVAQELGVNREAVNNFLPIAAAILALAMGFGGLAFKQYNNFKNKKIKFQKDVSDTLFFRSLATNVSVFHRLIDQAEEAEGKQAILVYYHLLTNGDREFTVEQLDAEIEQWMKDTVGVAINFDINEPIELLERIRDSEGRALLSRDAQGRCHVPTLQEACRIVDCVWDRFFNFHHAR